MSSLSLSPISMAVQALIHGALLLTLAFASAFLDPNDESKPNFAFSWAEDKDTYMAGETATIKVKILGNYDPHSYKFPFNPTTSVNGKPGNSTFISGLALNFGADVNSWTISFVPILVGVFNVLITDEFFSVLDSSLHFFVRPGQMHPSVSIVSWMDNVNNFEAGMRATLLVLPKDAFGNNVESTNAELNSFVFNVSESSANGSVINALSVTSLGWNDHGYLRIEFITSSAGNLLLHVQTNEQTLRGSPLSFSVYPGAVEVSKCLAVWKYGTNVSQLYSKTEIFIHQLDLYGNLVPGSYPFDAEIIEKSTHLSIPVADMNFKEFSPGIQLLEFGALEPGDFLLMIYNEKHNRSISNMPVEFTVLVGYCDGLNSIVNGSGLNHSLAGEEARFAVYLKDEYQYPSPVEPRMLQVKITHEIESYEVSPIIYPLETHKGNRSHWHIGNDAVDLFGAAPGPSISHNDNSTGVSQDLADSYRVIFTPDRSGIYDILVLCGNIPLNGGHSFKKEVKAGEVNVSMSGVVKYVPKIEKMVQNEVIVQLMDSFSNPVLSMESKLKLEIGSTNHSDFQIWTFVDNKSGSYTGQYMVKDVGTYEICASFDGNCLLPCPCGINAYSSEYFPRAHDDSVFVSEDESITFNAVENDYFAGEHAMITEFSNPHYGTLLHNELLFRYTPYKGFYGNDSFSYTISDINGNTATAYVSISVLSIPPQIVSLPANLRAIEDMLCPKFGGFHGLEISYPDLVKNISVTISANSGKVSLSPMMMLFWRPTWSEFLVSNSQEANKMTLSGPAEVINMVLQSLQYLGEENFYGDDTITISAGNKNRATNVNVTIFVEPINDPPLIRTPEFVLLQDSKDGNGSLIYRKEKDKFEFFIDDPDLLHFPGNKSDFLVSVSMEVTSGVLEAILPVQLVHTTELKLGNGKQWQPLQTFVTISEHFVVKARGVRFQGSIEDCNIILHHLKYHGTEYGAVLKIIVNDMGNYGCFPDCLENVSKPLLAEANVNLIKRRPLTSKTTHALGFIIILEFIVVLSLGVVLLFYTCKCAISLINERRSPNTNDNADHAIKTSDEHTKQNKLTTSTRCCSSPILRRCANSDFRRRQRSWQQSGGGNYYANNGHQNRS